MFYASCQVISIIDKFSNFRYEKQRQQDDSPRREHLQLQQLHTPAKVYSQNRPQVSKSTCRNIIEVTEEQESYPNNNPNSPKEASQHNIPHISKIKAVKNYFMCLSNLWRYICQSNTKVELDVND